MIGHIGSSGSMLIAWTGTDPVHHLNAATISTILPAVCETPPGVQAVSSTPIHTGNTSAKQVSLTFDSDNGSPGHATTYLDILERNHIKTTFFLTGLFANANPSIVRRMVADGDDIGNHTMDHPDLVNPPRTDAFICSELTSADSAIASAAGHSSRPYFRPPYGSYNSQVAERAAGLGYRTILWSIDPRDWDSTTTTQDILNRVLNSSSLKPGAIILMHINSTNEQYALQGVITGLQQKGFSIVPLSVLLS